MGRINISRVILRNRKSRNITQEELADYLCVSKASVSKWERGNGYPDILLLPKIAGYFDISIDELLGYSPQLSFKEIRFLYDYFGKKYQENRKDTIKEIEEKIKEYYSCYDFIIAMSQWFLNYGILNENNEEREKMIERSYQLSFRVFQNSDKIFYKNMSESILSYINLYRQEYDKVFEMLGKEAIMSTENMKNTLILKSYLSLGNIEKAKEISQVSIFQLVSELLNVLSIYQSINTNDKEKCHEIYSQIIEIIKIFNFDKNGNNSLFLSNLMMAELNAANGDLKLSISYLEKYYESAKKIKEPMLLGKNKYFELASEWLENSFCLGNNTPISEKQLKKNFLNAVSKNNAFKVLENEDDYKKLLKKLEELENEY